MVARDAVAGLRTDRRAVAADTRNLADLFQGVEVEDRQPFLDSRDCRGGISRSARADGVAGNVEASPFRLRVDVVPAALPANFRCLENFVRSGDRGLDG